MLIEIGYLEGVKVSLELHCHTEERPLSLQSRRGRERTVGPGTAGMKPWDIPWGQQDSRGVVHGVFRFKDHGQLGQKKKKICALSMGHKHQRSSDHGPNWTWTVDVSVATRTLPF